MSLREQDVFEDLYSFLLYVDHRFTWKTKVDCFIATGAFFSRDLDWLAKCSLRHTRVQENLDRPLHHTVHTLRKGPSPHF